MVTNNSTLKNKLRNYSILAGSVLATANTADAQIKYHDIKPDSLLSVDQATYIFDLNGDNVADFLFKKAVQASTVFAVFGFKNKSASFEGSIYTFGGGTKIGYPYVVNTGDKIGASGNWNNYSQLMNGTHAPYYANLAVSFGGSFFGNWGGGETAKFIGLRIKSGAKYNYGWVRCSVAAGGQSITVMDYGYQQIADSSINAGDTDVATTGIPAHQLQNVSVYSSGKTVTVKYPGAHNEMTIVVRDMTGKEIQTAQTTGELYEMNLSNSASGVYIVTVRTRDGVMTKKVSIQ